MLLDIVASCKISKSVLAGFLLNHSSIFDHLCCFLQECCTVNCDDMYHVGSGFDNRINTR